MILKLNAIIVLFQVAFATLSNSNSIAALLVVVALQSFLIYAWITGSSLTQNSRCTNVVATTVMHESFSLFEMTVTKYVFYILWNLMHEFLEGQVIMS